jgi:hypothetical protein
MPGAIDSLHPPNPTYHPKYTRLCFADHSCVRQVDGPMAMPPRKRNDAIHIRKWMGHVESRLDTGYVSILPLCGNTGLDGMGKYCSATRNETTEILASPKNDANGKRGDAIGPPLGRVFRKCLRSFTACGRSTGGRSNFICINQFMALSPQFWRVDIATRSWLTGFSVFIGISGLEFEGAEGCIVLNTDLGFAFIVDGSSGVRERLKDED